MMEKGTVFVFAKSPRPGEVKTRLAPEVGPEGASRLARAFFRDTWAVVSALPWAIPVLATTSANRREWNLGSDAQIWQQGAGDLGKRLGRVLRRGLAKSSFGIAIGIDTPGLPPALLEEARQALRSADAVLGPCEDGGFYLVGLRHCPVGLFGDLPWSAPDTFVRTLARLRERGLVTKVLPPWFDVDRPSDLSCLRNLLSRGEIVAPETKRVLEELATMLRGASCA